MSPARLLHLNTERGWRGGEVQTLLLAKGLVSRGSHCLLVAPPGSILEAKGLESGLEVETLDSRGEFDAGAIARLTTLCRRFAPQLIHYHTSHAITLGTLASVLGGRKPAVASRRVSFPLSRNPLARWKYTRRVDKIIAVSRGIQDQLTASGIPRERVTVIHSAVDLARFRELPTREQSREALGYDAQVYLVGAIGHMAKHKGHAVLVDAARILATHRPSLRFLLAGSGELEEALRHRIAEWQLEGMFRLLGFNEDVSRLLPALDLLVFPSLSGEGSPAVLKEAMACGVPIVASHISGVEEVIRDGREGLLVPPGDPDALAEAILRFATNRSLGIEFGRRGREHACDFGVDRMVQSTEELYRNLLGDHFS